jgi:hypothetical protein
MAGIVERAHGTIILKLEGRDALSKMPAITKKRLFRSMDDLQKFMDSYGLLIE